jgi:hypothetical protein
VTVLVTTVFAAMELTVSESMLTLGATNRRGPPAVRYRPDTFVRVLVTRDPVLNEPVEMLPPALFMKTFEALKLDTLSAMRSDPTRRLLTARFSVLKIFA